MTVFSPAAPYILGTACIGRGIMAILQPRAEYGHMGLPLESPAFPASLPPPSSAEADAVQAERQDQGKAQAQAQARAGPGTVDASQSGSVSPLMYFKGIREISYGLAMVAFQRLGYESALTAFAGILSFVRLGDGLIIWLHGGDELRHRASGHLITGVGFLAWVAWRIRVVGQLQDGLLLRN